MADDASIASAVRFSVTEEMRSLARQHSGHGRSLVVTTFLVGAPNKHSYGGTSFAQITSKIALRSHVAKGKKIFDVIDKLKAVSPALCTPNTTLLVAHDVAGLPAWKGGVRYHYVQPDPSSNSINRRWEIYERVLREYTFDCVCARTRTCVMQ